MEVTEKQEWRIRRKLLTHKKHRRRRRQQKDLHGSFQRPVRGKPLDPFSKRSVSDLVMILQKRKKCRERQPSCGFAPPRVMIGGIFALVRESLGQTATEMMQRLLHVVGIISVGFAGNQHVHGVVDVVIPLGVIKLNSVLPISYQVVRGVVAIFKDKVDVSLMGESLAYKFRQFDENIGLQVVIDFVDRVQTQAVKVIFLEPIQSIVVRGRITGFAIVTSSTALPVFTKPAATTVMH